MRLSPAYASVPAAILGGMISMLLVAFSVDWMLGGQPAEPSLLGFLQMAIFGAVCGNAWGFIAVVFLRDRFCQRPTS